MEYQDFIKQRDLHQALLTKEDEAIAKLQKKLEWHEKKRNKLWLKSGNFPHIIFPLCDEIKKRCGFEYCEIYGPFGMCCETSLYFSNVGTHNFRTYDSGWIDDRIDICNVETWHITLQPNDKYESGYEYFTGETTNNYPKGSIGELNGMNNVYKELPAEIDAIIKLLVHTPKEVEGEGTQTE